MAKEIDETVNIDNTESLTEEASASGIDPIKPVNVEGTDITQQTETIIIFKVNRPLMDHEYDELEKRVRQENEKSGLKIVIAPYSVDVEITGG